MLLVLFLFVRLKQQQDPPEILINCETCWTRRSKEMSVRCETQRVLLSRFVAKAWDSLRLVNHIRRPISFPTITNAYNPNHATSLQITHIPFHFLDLYFTHQDPSSSTALNIILHQEHHAYHQHPQPFTLCPELTQAFLGVVFLEPSRDASLGL